MGDYVGQILQSASQTDRILISASRADLIEGDPIYIQREDGVTRAQLSWDRPPGRGTLFLQSAIDVSEGDYVYLDVGAFTEFRSNQVGQLNALGDFVDDLAVEHIGGLSDILDDLDQLSDGQSTRLTNYIERQPAVARLNRSKDGDYSSISLRDIEGYISRGDMLDVINSNTGEHYTVEVDRNIIPGSFADVPLAESSEIKAPAGSPVIFANAKFGTLFDQRDDQISLLEGDLSLIKETNRILERDLKDVSDRAYRAISRISLIDGQIALISANNQGQNAAINVASNRITSTVEGRINSGKIASLGQDYLDPEDTEDVDELILDSDGLKARVMVGDRLYVANRDGGNPIEVIVRQDTNNPGYIDRGPDRPGEYSTSDTEILPIEQIAEFEAEEGSAIHVEESEILDTGRVRSRMTQDMFGFIFEANRFVSDDFDGVIDEQTGEFIEHGSTGWGIAGDGTASFQKGFIANWEIADGVLKSEADEGDFLELNSVEPSINFSSIINGDPYRFLSIRRDLELPSDDDLITDVDESFAPAFTITVDPESSTTDSVGPFDASDKGIMLVEFDWGMITSTGVTNVQQTITIMGIYPNDDERVIFTDTKTSPGLRSVSELMDFTVYESIEIYFTAVNPNDNQSFEVGFDDPPTWASYKPKTVINPGGVFSLVAPGRLLSLATGTVSAAPSNGNGNGNGISELEDLIPGTGLTGPTYDGTEQAIWDFDTTWGDNRYGRLGAENTWDDNQTYEGDWLWIPSSSSYFQIDGRLGIDITPFGGGRMGDSSVQFNSSMDISGGINWYEDHPDDGWRSTWSVFPTGSATSDVRLLNIRNYRSDFAVAQIASASLADGDALLNEDSEATLALYRGTSDESHAEIMDLFNNGYHSSPEDNTVVHGIRILARGDGELRPFVIDSRDADDNYNLSILVDHGNQVEFHDLGRFMGDAIVEGNLHVLGTEFIAETETVRIEDNLGVINYGEQGSGVTAGFAGWEVDRGSATDYRFGFEESSGFFKLGEVDDLQAVATRQDSPTQGGIPFWQESETWFETSSNFTWIDPNLDLEGNFRVEGDIQSDHFDLTTDFTGTGHFVDREGNANLATLTIREYLRAREFIIDQLSVTAGSRMMSAARGRIESIDGNTITLEDPNETGASSFAEDDLFVVRIIDIDGAVIKMVTGIVTDVDGLEVTLSQDSGDLPSGDSPSGDISDLSAGDVIVQRGNTSDSNRQNIIYETATDTDAPVTKYLSGIDSLAAFDDSSNIVTQVGTLDDQGNLVGFGLYGANVYLTESVLIGDLDKNANYFEFDNGVLTVDARSFFLQDDNENITLDSDTGITVTTHQILNNGNFSFAGGILSGDENSVQLAAFTVDSDKMYSGSSSFGVSGIFLDADGDRFSLADSFLYENGDIDLAGNFNLSGQITLERVEGSGNGVFINSGLLTVPMADPEGPSHDIEEDGDPEIMLNFSAGSGSFNVSGLLNSDTITMDTDSQLPIEIVGDLYYRYIDLTDGQQTSVQDDTALQVAIWVPGSKRIISQRWTGEEIEDSLSNDSSNPEPLRFNFYIPENFAGSTDLRVQLWANTGSQDNVQLILSYSNVTAQAYRPTTTLNQNGLFTAISQSVVIPAGQPPEAGGTAGGAAPGGHPQVDGANDTNNSGGSVVQNLEFDEFGHVTSTSSIDLDSLYTRSTSLNISNWDTAYDDSPTNVSVTGGGNSSIEVTVDRRNSSNLSNSVNTSHTHGFGDLPISDNDVSNWDTAYDDSPTNVSVSGSGNGNLQVTVSRRSSANIEGSTDLSHSHGFGDLPISSNDTDNWDTAYDRSPTDVSFSGGTLTVDQQDGSISTSLDGRYLELSGGMMDGDIDMDGNDIYDVRILEANEYISVDGGLLYLDGGSYPRYEVRDSSQDEQVVVGYLEGLDQFDEDGEPTGSQYGSSAYGIWLLPGANAIVDGEYHQQGGSWLVEENASFRVVTPGEEDIIRLGTLGAERGLFLFSNGGSPIVSLTSSGLVADGAFDFQAGDDFWRTTDNAFRFGGSQGIYSDQGNVILGTNTVIEGSLNAASGTFAGTLQAVDGEFSGSLDAVDGTFTGTLQAVDGDFTGTLSGVDGTFTGTLQAVDGEFTGSLDAVDGTFTGTLSGVDGDFSGSITADSLVINTDFSLGRVMTVASDGEIKSDAYRFTDHEIALYAPTVSGPVAQQPIIWYNNFENLTDQVAAIGAYNEFGIEGMRIRVGNQYNVYVGDDGYGFLVQDDDYQNMVGADEIQGTNIYGNVKIWDLPIDDGSLSSGSLEVTGNLEVADQSTFGGEVTFNQDFITHDGSSRRRWVMDREGASGNTWVQGIWAREWRWGIGDVSGTTYVAELTEDGDFYANNFIVDSDPSLKENWRIQDSANFHQAIRDINAYQFDWIASGESDLGLNAEEVETYFPEFVFYGKEGTRRLDYGKFGAYVGLYGLKQLVEENERLWERIAHLEQKLGG